MVALCLDLNKEFDIEEYIFEPDSAQHTDNGFLTISNLHALGDEEPGTCKYMGLMVNRRYTIQSRRIHIPPNAMELWKDDNTILFYRHTTAGRRTVNILDSLRATPAMNGKDWRVRRLAELEKLDAKRADKYGYGYGSTYWRFKERGHLTNLHACRVPVWTRYELGRMEFVFEKYGIYQLDVDRRRTGDSRIPR